MTEDGSMEQIGSTECCALRFCLHIGLLVRRRSAEPFFCRFFAAPVLQHSRSEWRIVILRPSRKFHPCGASVVLLWWK